MPPTPRMRQAIMWRLNPSQSLDICPLINLPLSRLLLEMMLQLVFHIINRDAKQKLSVVDVVHDATLGSGELKTQTPGNATNWRNRKIERNKSWEKERR